jgi:hypothetical protein
MSSASAHRSANTQPGSVAPGGGRKPGIVSSLPLSLRAGHGSRGRHRPTHNFLNVYHGPELVMLGLAGIAIVIIGALLPAGWTAGIKTASALRAG